MGLVAYIGRGQPQIIYKPQYMNRIKTEILHFKQGKSHDKVYIVEVLEHDKQYYVYAYYGKRTQEHLVRQFKHIADFQGEAVDHFNLLVRKKIKAGYKMLANNSHIDIPGMKHLLSVHSVKTDMVKKIEKAEEKIVIEHRKLLV
jgi:hypothetical protein